MMTGLMMVFLLISVAFMQVVKEENKAIQKIAYTYRDLREELYIGLRKEFKNDLKRWNAEILEDSTIRFNEPNVLFSEGSSVIKPRFARILNEFFPRYVAFLASDKYQANIEEIRIEGHTSSTWEESSNLEERYLKNAHLSQERSLSILQYSFALPTIYTYRDWLTKVLRANGLAFANPILTDSGAEDRSRSRRVEFKVTTKAEERINQIISTIREERR